MISDRLLEEAKEVMNENAQKFGAPATFHVDISNRVGQRLSNEVGAKDKIVYLGTILMDCMLGPAMKEGVLQEHVVMSEEKTNEILDKFPDVEPEEKENILACVRQHHGGEDFYSIEAEVCCNADCYRFLSVEGVLGGAMDFRDISVEEFVSLFLGKLEEKWNVLTLDICKRELEPQCEVIKSFLEGYQKSF